MKARRCGAAFLATLTRAALALRAARSGALGTLRLAS